MDQAILVELDRGLGQLLVAELDRRELDVEVVVLAKFEEYSESRLVLAARSFEEHESAFNYLQFGNVLRSFGTMDERPSLLLMRMTDPFVIALRKRLGEVENEKGMRLSQEAVGNRYVDLGYVYRVR